MTINRGMLTPLIVSVLISAGCSLKPSTVNKPKPLELCIADAYSMCDRLSPWNEESEVGTYLQRTVLLYRLCALKQEILVRCLQEQ